MKIIIYLLFLITPALTIAQSVSMHMLGSVGGNISSGNVSIQHSLGSYTGTVIEESSRLDQGMFLACDISCQNIKTSLNSLKYDHPLISFHPNPTEKSIYLSGEPASIYRYELYTVTGNLLESKLITDDQISLDHMPGGMYLLKVFGRNKALTLLAKVIRE